MTPTECRMARSGVRFSAEDLAPCVDLSPAAIRSYENNGGGLHATVDKIRAYFVSRGIAFVSETEADRQGVILPPPSPPSLDAAAE